MGNNYTQLPSGDWAENINMTNAYDQTDDMMKVKSMQTKWRAGFTGTELNPNKWDIKQIGEGQSISVVNGELQINTGVVANAETIITSKQEFTVPMRTMMNVKLSQRIANQEFYVELVSTDKETGEPTSHSTAGWLFDGISATKAKYIVNGGDQPVLVSPENTVSSTATAGSIFEIEPTADEAWFFSRTIDTTAGRAYSFVRHSQIPDPNRKYKLQIRVKNLATAPISNTVFGSQFVSVSDYAELTAEITAGRGSSVGGQAIATMPAGGTLTTVSTVTTANSRNAGLWYAETSTNLPANQIFTGTARATGTSSAVNYSKIRVRVYSATAGTLYIDQAKSSTTTDYRCPDGHSFEVQAGQCIMVEVPVLAYYARIRFQNGAVAHTGTGVFEIISHLVGVS